MRYYCCHEPEEKRFPNESDVYRKAREELLEAEIALRSQIEKVAERRRALPTSGPVKEDYVFERLSKTGAVENARLSELFTSGKTSLVAYSYMYGPKMPPPQAGPLELRPDAVKFEMPPDRVQLVQPAQPGQPVRPDPPAVVEPLAPAR